MPKKSMEERKYEAYLAEKKELEAEIDEIEAEKKEIEAKIDQIDEKIGSLDVEISKLRMQVLGKKGEFTASAKLDLEEFQEKKRKLEKRNDSLEKDKDNLEKRIQILTGTRFSHFAEEQIADIVSSVILGVKRAFEDSEAGTIASKISSSCEEDLKKKILPIYSKCPFYGSPAEACEASHIIPYSYANHPFTAVSLVII